MLSDKEMDTLKQIAAALAKQFGRNCEVVIHELSSHSVESSIVAIENGHVSGRKIGDGPSPVVLEQLYNSSEDIKDHTAYLTKTEDGRTLKSTSIYIRDHFGKVSAIFSINFDVSAFQHVESILSEFTKTDPLPDNEPEKIPLNVNQLLDDLISRADALVGKPVALMNKDDKANAIRFLNEKGALLITKSGDKIARHYEISKYTMYSYLNSVTEEDASASDHGNESAH